MAVLKSDVRIDKIMVFSFFFSCSYVIYPHRLAFSPSILYAISLRHRSNFFECLERDCTPPLSDVIYALRSFVKSLFLDHCCLTIIYLALITRVWSIKKWERAAIFVEGIIRP